MNNSVKKSGETLIEVVIALSVFMVVLAPASALFVSSLRTINTNRNDLAAAALAEEGVELVRNVRDTNLLKFSPKAEDCWNTVVGHEELSSCDQSAYRIQPGPYRIGMDVFDAVALPLLMELQGDPLTDALEPAYRLRLDGGSNLYHHGSGGAETGFYREVKIEAVGSDGTAVRVTSSVKYVSGSRIRTVKRSAILTNHPQ